ncbi:hypothetical protein VQ02_29035 [Methylobacterium variabile]|jgi:hypothetical protein|uniref:DUF3016 domain-containing protein n=1 Tax=Methylobacterium variabile TaxID=298794 RepID=A0A0J6S8T9_9HYPH|nr:DUF3016 domain-containing protein [Methylobacterium variabile]KMO29808.1 hypothetical protein VQ02_29035 [Methylobacterium variabile]
MRSFVRRVSAALLVLVLGQSAWAEAPLALRFVAPERYTDAESRLGSGPTLRATLGELERIFRDLAGRTLRPGQSLAIDVLDVDLAGIELPGAGTTVPRVVTDAGPPRFRLRYALRENGRVVQEAEETVTDINFLLRTRPGGQSALYYEREILADWFQARIARRQPPRG